MSKGILSAVQRYASDGVAGKESSASPRRRTSLCDYRRGGHYRFCLSNRAITQVLTVSLEVKQVEQSKLKSA